jgi:hypothetical protein
MTDAPRTMDIRGEKLSGSYTATELVQRFLDLTHIRRPF